LPPACPVLKHMFLLYHLETIGAHGRNRVGPQLRRPWWDWIVHGHKAKSRVTHCPHAALKVHGKH
jgi:hypothetical protein